MALTPRVIDCPIRPSNQQAPITSAPVGRLKELVNKVATRNEGGPDGPSDPPGSGVRLTVESRKGFQALPVEVRDVTTGALVSSTAGVPGANLVATLGSEVVAVAGSVPYVLTENSPAWSKYPYIYSPVTARTKQVVSDNIQVAAPDGATIGGKIFRCWSQPETIGSSSVGVMAMVTDIDGTVVRAPWNVATGDFSLRAKVVSDGTRFWLACSLLTSIMVMCFDTHGVQIGSTLTLAAILVTKGSPWDVTFCEGYVLFVHAPNFNAEIRKFTISGTTLSSATYAMGNVARADHGVAWAENADADGNAYLLTAHQYVTIVEYAFRIGNLSTSPSVTGYFSVGQSSGDGIIYDQDGEGHTSGGIGLTPAEGTLFEMTGIFRGGVLYAQLSFAEYPGDVGGDVRDARIVPIVATIGALATVQATVRTVHAASRVFRHDGRDVLLVYFPSAATVIQGTFPDQTAVVGEPTYFLLDVLTRQVCGRLSPGTAGMEWTRKGWPEGALLTENKGAFLFHLAHVFVDTAGITHVPCCVQSRQFSNTVELLVEARSGAGHFSPTRTVTTAIVSAIGYQDIELGGVGQALEFGGELLLPGAIATSFDGANFSENGINLAPSQPTIVASSGGSIENGRREYIVVFQSINRNGDRVFSEPSAAVAITYTGSNGTGTLTGRSLRMTTHQNITIAIYATIMVSGVPTTVHYRVDDPLNPVVNDQMSATWTFVDTKAAATIQANEVLYTDNDFRVRDPMPPFSTADIFEGRAVCDSPDGSIWFSAQKAEGDAAWFSASQRIQAVTAEPLKNLVAMDGRLIEIYDKHVWAQDGTGMPGPTNSQVSSIRPAEKTTFTNGGTGFARLVNEGVMYSSSEGGVWLVTRGLLNQRVTGPVVDDIAAMTVTGIVVDAQQRIHIGARLGLSSYTSDIVFDQLSGIWSRFEAPVDPLVMHTLRGKILFADAFGIYAEGGDTVYTDVNHAGTQQYITGVIRFMPFRFSGVKGFSRLWRFNVQGVNLNNHTVTLQAQYDPDTTTPIITEAWTWAVDVADKWAFEFQPKMEQIEAVQIAIIESFPAGPTYSGQSFRLEMMGFEVGTESGLARVPLAKRIQST